MAILIKGGTLVTAEETISADILIDGEMILQTGLNLQIADAEILDASGKLILPGGVDPHTHFDLPMAGTVSSDDHYTGHKAAAFGGTTTVIDYVSFDFPTFRESVDAWHKKAEKAAIDYSFHMNLTHFDEQVAVEIPSLVEMGITSLKVFTAYNGRLRIDDGSIFKALRIAKENGMLVLAHCENGDVIEALIAEARTAHHLTPEWHAKTRPAWGAVEATLRGAALAAQAGAALYIVHMNAAGEVDQLAYARAHGLHIMGETCPQYLLFTEEDLKRPDGAKWVCSPPVRTAQDNRRIWEGLADGTIQVLATDHCAFFYDGTQPIQYEGKAVAIPGKELGKADFSKIPNGLPGVGDRLPVMFTCISDHNISLSRFVALTSADPARIFGLYPRKGALLPGSDADVVIWDPTKRVTYGAAYAQHRTDYNLYEGMQLQGFPEKVYLRGQLIVDRGAWLGKAGMGEFLPRKPYAPIL